MARHGEGKSQKSLSVSKVRALSRKKNVWTIRMRTGPHNKYAAVPLLFIIRDILKLAGNKKEAKHLLNNREVKVNGVVRKDAKFAVGLFDIVDLEKIKNRYRVVLDGKGRIVLNEIPVKSKLEKVCKVMAKRTVKKGREQIVTNDGINILTHGKSKKLSVGDSIKISLPEKKILEILEAKKGNKAYIFSGTHTGMLAKIVEIAPRTMLKPKLITLESGGKEFRTTEKNIVVIGKSKVAIELGG